MLSFAALLFVALYLAVLEISSPGFAALRNSLPLVYWSFVAGVGLCWLLIHSQRHGSSFYEPRSWAPLIGSVFAFSMIAIGPQFFKSDD